MIILSDISKSFSGKSIFKKASLEINPGDNIILTGPNGSGKTTLLMILKKLYLIDEGHYYCDPKFLDQSSISYISKKHNSFFMRLTVLQNLNFFYDLCINKNKISKEEIFLMLKEFDLLEHLDSEFMTLSSGQAQKLCIIRGLMKNPKITLFDESFSSLDDNSKEKFKEIYFKHLKKDQGNSTLWVTHNKHELEFKDNRYLEILNGKIKESYES